MKRNSNSFYRALSAIFAMSFLFFIEADGKEQLIPDYAPGSLIVKFSTTATTNGEFNLRVEKGIVVTGITSIDLLNKIHQAFI